MVKIGDKYLHSICILSLLFMLNGLGMAQNLEEIGKSKPVKLSGNVSLRGNMYRSNRMETYRLPYFYTISGNPTLDIYGVTLPFTFVYSQKNTDFRQPFNQFGLSPFYKWLTVHLGHRAVTFSDFSLSNHIFLGAGFEANPGLLRAGFVYGRFLKAVDPPKDTLATEFLIPTFSRRGWAARLGIGKNTNFLDLVVFKGKDDPRSIEQDLNSVERVSPAENLVIGLKSRQMFFKRVFLDVDYGLSIYTNDQFAMQLDLGDFQRYTSLMAINASTLASMAMKANLAYRHKYFNLGMLYMRVEPDYQSMGAYFLNNDYENFTVNPSLSLLKYKLRLSGSVGVQRNNLFKDKLNNTFRQVSNFNIALNPSAKYGINLSYGNFQVNQERNVLLALDTLQLQQFSNSMSGNFFYNFRKGNVRHSITPSMSYQEFRDEGSIEGFRVRTSSLSPNIGYRYAHITRKLNINVNINHNSFSSGANTTKRTGGTLGVNQRNKDDKLNIGLSTTYLLHNFNGSRHSNSISLTGNAGYTPKKQHNITASLSFIHRNMIRKELDDTTDMIGNLAYTYSF